MKNNKGTTIVELLAGSFIFTIIAVSVFTLMVSVVSLYSKSNDLSEINFIFDNVSKIMLNDVNNARKIAISETELKIIGQDSITYKIHDGIPQKSVNNSDYYPIFEKGYYKNKTLNLEYYDKNYEQIIKVKENLEVFIIRLIILSKDNVTSTRDYAVRPLGLG